MMDQEEIIHVYFMPGMAANAAIFEYIKLPEDKFKMHFLEWIIPLDDESLKDYALRMNKYVKHDNIVLIGVSFGGVVVQEMSNYISVRRLIIISSVKCRDELPRRMRFAAKTGFFKLIPTSLLDYVDHFEKLAVNDFLKKRARLYRKYLSVRNNKYLDWAIKNMVCWGCEKPREDLVHIHGDADLIFPIKYIRNCIPVKGGTHIMIINRYRWFNRHLPEIILTGGLNKKKMNKIEKR
ncbi:alpha/beta hydrolase [Antarcticibacterium flavum]|uniref:Alpha/beta hydrolase n=2 Tax=Antarcticibacterium flavum TaxID=2058175 RepID=A0A5B7X9G4_9FLAO|nr:alpha/beta hydrolase [Antarcticibacterium flavum]MCM4160382.1 alpha/beta hydrolase [Antarcticibacterium sp. W02-3]QCY71241.1 alpha/beta hydrolase [Antarcticibacterium flavum]